MTRLLVVDFDYFFPVIEREQDERFDGECSLYDWGHSEADRIFYEYVWRFRAAAFIERGLPLPEVDRAAIRAFWARFDIDPKATLFYADSNMYAAHERIRRGVNEVWLYDAHHDTGYHPDAWARALKTHEVNCEQWMLAHYANDADLHMRYPAWRHYGPEIEPRPVVPIDCAVDDGAPPPGRFNRVFVCKSPAWVPSWCDADWQAFIEAAPLRRKVSIDESKIVRSFDLRDAEQHARDMAEVLASMRGATPDGGTTHDATEAER